MKTDTTQSSPHVKQVARATQAIQSIQIPLPAYYVFLIEEEKTSIEILGEDPQLLPVGYSQKKQLKKSMDAWLRKRGKTSKCIAAHIYAPVQLHSLITRLWLTHDVVPFFTPTDPLAKTSLRQDDAVRLRKRFDENNLVKIRLSASNEVDPGELVLLDAYKKMEKECITKLTAFSKKLNKHRFVFVSASPQGGGVALMRHSLVRLFRLLEVDAHWHVLAPSKEAFDITKTKFHNILQGVALGGTELLRKDKEFYESWIQNNALLLRESYKDASVVVIDDPQPSGLIPFIKEGNPSAKVVYRSHIHIDSGLADIPDTPQHATWNYLFQFIRRADIFVSHPISEFVPHDIPRDNVVTMPASTDPLDGLNKTLSAAQREYYLSGVNRILLETGQTALDAERPYIIQVSRFDPSKGIPDVLEAYELFCTGAGGLKRLPQLVLCGHSSIDDPDGTAVYSFTMNRIREKYGSLAKEIKVASLPPSDQMLNVLLSGATVALQLSHKEGFEVKVTESLMKGVPVIGYKTGGIQLQINDGVNGFLVPVGNTRIVSEHLLHMFTMPALVDSLRKGTTHRYGGTTTAENAFRWLSLFEKSVKA